MFFVLFYGLRKTHSGGKEVHQWEIIPPKSNIFVSLIWRGIKIEAAQTKERRVPRQSELTQGKSDPLKPIFGHGKWHDSSGV